MASLSSGFRILRSLADVKPDMRHFRRIYESGLRLNSSRTLCTQTNAGAKPQTDAPNPAEQQPSSSSTDETASKNQSAIEELNKLLVEANKQKDELNDKYKRALAESENMRKRLMKQIEEAKMYGIQSFCKDLLEVADVLGKATECVPKEEVKDSNPHLKNLYVGLTMTEAELVKVFKRHGLVPVNPLDEKFDPNFHEALFQQEVEGKEPGTVVVVSKIGYKLHERVVRPALVGVAKG